jgi:hypothetical protein
MSESQKIADLRAKLMQIEQSAPVSEAIPLAAPAIAAGARAAAPHIARGAASLAGKAKNAFQNFKRGMSGQQARTQSGTFTQAGSATKAGQAATAAGQAIKNNPVTALSTAGTAGYMAGQAGQKPAAQPAAQPPVAGKPATTPQKAPQAKPAATLTAAEEGELGTLAQELDSFMGQDPELDNLILQYQKLRPGAVDAQV